MMSDLTLLPLGGLGEIGMNGLVLNYKGQRWLIDCGAMFEDDVWTSGDLVLPDLEWIHRHRKSFAGMVITHGHEDHIGAVPFVLKEAMMPVYASPFTHGLMSRKLEEHGLAGKVDQRILEPNMSRNGKPGVTPPESPDLGFSFIRVTHSIPDAASLVIHTPMGVIIHTADFKIDPDPIDGQAFDKHAFRTLGDQGVMLLLSDSTNAQVPGHTKGEREVQEGLEEQISAWPGRVLVTQFASNLHRLRAIEEIAKRCNRRLCLVGRSLHTYSEIARKAGIKSIDESRLVDEYHLNEVPDEELLIVLTGSQGEKRAALHRASMDNNPRLKINKGDLILWSARFIPGNEREIWRIINNLTLRGATVVHPMAAPIHTSGHARQDELLEMLNLVRPKHFIPVHGEYAFLLAHQELARKTGVKSTKVIRNGEELAVSDDGMQLVAEHPLITYYYDGTVVATAEDHAFKERFRTYYNGVIAAHVTVRRKSRLLDPSVSLQSRGVYIDQGVLLDEAANHVLDALGQLESSASPDAIKDLTSVTIRRTFRREVGKKPVVMTFVTER